MAGVGEEDGRILENSKVEGYEVVPNLKKNRQEENNHVPMMDHESEGSKDKNEDSGDMGNLNSIKYVYRDATWDQDNFTYDPRPQELGGVLETKIS